MKLVISLGGSLLTQDFSASGLKKYAEVLKKIAAKTEKLVVIVGGGKVCREYQKIARELKASQDMQDYIGIKSTHFNASLVASLLDDCVEVPNNEKELVLALRKRNVVVGGGLKVGQSTDAVAAFAAKTIKADLLVNASNIDGVYEADPRKKKGAKKIQRTTYAQLKTILSKNAQLPGQYGLFDLRAVETITKSKIKTVFVDGTNAEEIYRAVFGKHNGTIVEEVK